jgi:hypothetical protein
MNENNKKILYHTFSKYLFDLGDNNKLTDREILEALIIMTDNTMDDFIKLYKKEILLINNTTNLSKLFENFLIFLKTLKKFNFNVDKDIIIYKDCFIQAGIKNQNDINKKNLILLCTYIYNTSNKNINNCCIYATATAYLQINNKLLKDQELSYSELLNCHGRNSFISENFTLKDIIDYIEGIGWLFKYLANEDNFSKSEIIIKNEFNKQFNNMLKKNNFLSTEIFRAHNIIKNKNQFDNFIMINKNEIILINNKSDLTDLFNKFKFFIDFKESFSFIVTTDNKYYQSFIDANILSDKDLNKESLSTLCYNIINNSEDKNLYSNSVYALAKAYLHTINKLNNDNKLSFQDLLYCEYKYGSITDRLNMRDIINYVEDTNWLYKYVNKNNDE